MSNSEELKYMCHLVENFKGVFPLDGDYNRFPPSSTFKIIVNRTIDMLRRFIVFGFGILWRNLINHACSVIGTVHHLSL